MAARVTRVARAFRGCPKTEKNFPAAARAGGLPRDLLQADRRVGAGHGSGDGGRARHGHAGPAIDVADDLRVHRSSRAKHDNTLDGVLQFADVARPVVVDEDAHRVGWNVDGATVLRVELLEEEVDEARNLFPALTQRRGMGRDYREPVGEDLAGLMSAPACL